MFKHKLENFLCSIGIHDWEVARTSSELGLTWDHGIVEITEENKLYVREISDKVCLRCNKCDLEIERCEKAHNLKLSKKFEKERQESERRRIAEKLYNNRCRKYE